MAAGWRYVLLALGIVTPGFAWLLGAILCWGTFFRPRRRGQLPVAPVHWLRWAVVFSVLGLIVQASRPSGRPCRPAPPYCTTGPVPFSVPAHTEVTNVQLLSLQARATWTLG